MRNEEIAAEFARHGDWITRFVIDGVNYGGSFEGIEDPRLPVFFEALPGVKKILELGSLEGGHSIGLARQKGVTEVLGVEGRSANLARAELAKRLLKADKVRFLQANLETVPLKDFGCFDAIFCSGLLYHLPQPWLLLRQFVEVSPRAFIWTHYCADKDADTMRGSYKGCIKTEGGAGERLSGLSPDSFWPTLGSLAQMLNEAGFPVLHILRNEYDHTDGPAVTIAAFAEAGLALGKDTQLQLEA